MRGQLSLLAGLGDAPDPQPGSSDEFYTPSPYFNRWNEEAGGFTVDTCATRESTKVKRFYDYFADGLIQSYVGERPWTNPPYSGIEPWVELAWRWMREGALGWWMLLPNWSDRAWWQNEVEPFRDVPASTVRPTYEKKTANPRVIQPRPWASLETRTLPRIQFGIPGDPEGLGPEAQKVGAKIYPVLLIWRLV